MDSGSGAISGTVAGNADINGPYSVTVTATDSTANASVSQTFNWTVNPAYVVVVQGDQYNVAGDTVSQSLYSWNTPNHSVTFSATGLPAGLSIDSTTGTISGTIAYGSDSASPYPVTITGTDSAGGVSGTASFNWNVETPVVTVESPGNLESLVGATVDLPIAAMDTDVATLSYSFSGEPSGLIIDSSTGEISGTLASNADVASPYSITVTATDGDAGISNSATFSLAVSHLVLVNPGDQENLVGDTVGLTIAAPYADSGTLAFSASGLPSGLKIDTGSGVISGTIASNANTGSAYSVTVSLTDGTLSASKTFTWSVKKLFLANPGTQDNIDGDTVSVALSISKLSGDTVIYTASGLPPGLSISATTGVISGTIADDLDQVLNIGVTATDTDANVSETQRLRWLIRQQQSLADVPLAPPLFPVLPRRPGETADQWAVRQRTALAVRMTVLQNAITATNRNVTVLIEDIVDMIVANPRGFLGNPNFSLTVTTMLRWSSQNQDREYQMAEYAQYNSALYLYIMRIQYGAN